MTTVKVNVKWGKEAFNDVEVDLSQTPMVFKAQLFALSGVPPERQKVMVKGGLLKDDDWGKQAPKEGASIMLMGSAEAVCVEAPKVALAFVEDLPESEQATLATKAYGSGLTNLGNTCYMNSTVQCLYAVEPLKAAIARFQPLAGDQGAKLVLATKNLFRDMERGGEAFPPFGFLVSLRERYPQFSQQTSQGQFMQQDAEECYSSMVYTLKEALKDPEGELVVNNTFGIGLNMKLKSEESGEEIEESVTSYMLKVNINATVNHVHEGIALGLKDDREKNSEALGRSVVFTGSSTITRLPPCLTVQMMRFFYKADVNQKAKILRKVSYGMELDVYDFCSEDLKKKLDGPRDAYKAYKDRQIEAEKKAKNEKIKADKLKAAGGGDVPSDKAAPPAAAATAAVPPAAASEAAVTATSVGQAGTSTSADAPAADGTAVAADTEMVDAGAGSSSAAAVSHAGAQTGKYELFALLTHKGRSADSGHYVAWIKQTSGQWVLFDDENIIPKTPEEVLDLAGGGDWHMAYLLLYREVLVPAS